MFAPSDHDCQDTGCREARHWVTKGGFNQGALNSIRIL